MVGGADAVLARKVRLEFELVDAGKTLHQALHYKMLGSPE